jgi:hypothetical protein
MQEARRTRRSARAVFLNYLHVNKQAVEPGNLSESSTNKLDEISHSLRQRINSAVHGLSHLVNETGTRLTRIRNNVQQILSRVVTDVRQRGHVGIPQDLETGHGIRQRIRERKQYGNGFRLAVDQAVRDGWMFEPARTAVDGVFRGSEQAETLQVTSYSHYLIVFIEIRY